MKFVIALITLVLPSTLWASWWDFFSSTKIKADEQLVFFPSEAYHNNKDGSWSIQIHGWIFEAETLGEINAVLRKALAIPADNNNNDKSLLQQRAHWFKVDNERGKRISIRLGNNIFTMNKSAANGHFYTELQVSNAVMQSLLTSSSETNLIRYDAVLPDNDKRSFSGMVHVVPDTGLSIISDIDDTIKISNVSDKKELIKNTFMRPFQVAPGMADLYRQWQQQHAAVFHYVSASPWQLHPALNVFMQQAGFPQGLFYMKSFRWKDSSFLNLFADPIEYKIEILESILKRYPQRRFMLVGDSGEKDPEVYGLIARKYPAQIEHILIRKVGENNREQRFSDAFDGLHSSLWKTFTHTDEIQINK